MNDKDIFAMLQLLRDLLANIRFYTANIPKEILPNNDWDKMRQNFSEIDLIISEAQGRISNQVGTMANIVNVHDVDKVIQTINSRTEKYMNEYKQKTAYNKSENGGKTMNALKMSKRNTLDKYDTDKLKKAYVEVLEVYEFNYPSPLSDRLETILNKINEVVDKYCEK